MCNSCLCNPSPAPISSLWSDWHLSRHAHDDDRLVTAGKVTISRWIYNNTKRRLLIDSQTQLSSIQTKHNEPKCFSLPIYSANRRLTNALMSSSPMILRFLLLSKTEHVDNLYQITVQSTSQIYTCRVRKPHAHLPQGSFCLRFAFWHLPPKLSPAILNLSRRGFASPCMASIAWPL